MSKTIGLIKKSGEDMARLRVTSYCGREGVKMIQLTQQHTKDVKPNYIQLTIYDAIELYEILRKFPNNEEIEIDSVARIPVEQENKQPLGIKPKNIWLEERILELSKEITKHTSESNYDVRDLVIELTENLNMLDKI